MSAHETSCTCVSAPQETPASPPQDVADSVWPDQWVANVESWTYSDYANGTSVAKGRFYYNAKLGMSRSDWSPYINGKNAKQVWIGATADSSKSKYYVKNGPLCLYFPIHDPGFAGTLIGVEKPNWMQSCDDAGYAHFVGREQVRVEPQEVWADHWSCRLEYAAANQTITFQNWHSLGVEHIPKGLPIRVTGGNSAPDPQQGSPRLNTVWYKNFYTGEGATKAEDFHAPNFGGRFCIPVGKSEAEAFFGHELTRGHTFWPDFHRRAHFLPHAQPTARDLVRARQPKPGRAFAGSHFADAMAKLNAALGREPGLATALCNEMPLSALQAAQRLLFDARTPELNRIYRDAGDSRAMAHATLASLQEEQAKVRAMEANQKEFLAKARDGACHEAVMWYTHHLSESAREAVKEQLVLPTLPEAQHEEPAASADADAHEAHRRYGEQISCAICHIEPSAAAVTV